VTSLIKAVRNSSMGSPLTALIVAGERDGGLGRGTRECLGKAIHYFDVRKIAGEGNRQLRKKTGKNM